MRKLFYLFDLSINKEKFSKDPIEYELLKTKQALKKKIIHAIKKTK